jgi:hypothetical protein
VPIRRCKELRANHSAGGLTCIVPRCSTRNCTVVLPRRGAVCIKCDLCDALPDSENRPDFIAYFDDAGSKRDVWLVVEVKGRLDDINHIQRQLQAGADAIQYHELYRLEPARTRRLIPVVLFDGHARSSDCTVLGSRRIRAFEVKFPIVYRRCRNPVSLVDLI